MPLKLQLYVPISSNQGVLIGPKRSLSGVLIEQAPIKDWVVSSYTAYAAGLPLTTSTVLVTSLHPSHLPFLLEVSALAHGKWDKVASSIDLQGGCLHILWISDRM